MTPKAFTYLIGWKALDRWYYGVRYARGCHPDDLWTKYFTSSKAVIDFKEVHGDPDHIEVRQIFDNVEKARLWENTVLKRLRVTLNDKWLNKTDNKSISPEAASQPGSKNPMYGKTHSPETKKWLSRNNPAKRPEVREKMSRSAKGKKKPSQSEQHKINRGIYVTGKTHSEETKIKIGQASRNRSDLSRKKTSDATRGKTSVYDLHENKTKRISITEFNENRSRYVSVTSKRYREEIYVFRSILPST